MGNPLAAGPHPIPVRDTDLGALLLEFHEEWRHHQIERLPMVFRLYDPEPQGNIPPVPNIVDVSRPYLLWTFPDTTRLSNIIVCADLNPPDLVYVKGVNFRILVCGPTTGQPSVWAGPGPGHERGEPVVVRFGGQEILDFRLTSTLPTLTLGAFEIVIPAGHSLYVSMDSYSLPYFSWSCNAEPVRPTHARPNQSPDLL